MTSNNQRVISGTQLAGQIIAGHSISDNFPKRNDKQITDAEAEFADKVWYNRHCNMLWSIEAGEIRVVPEGSAESGNSVIHQNILDGAIRAAEAMRQKYGEIGPFTDFEWGMLNGKLSALRWVYGEEWDMLYT